MKNRENDHLKSANKRTLSIKYALHDQQWKKTSDKTYKKSRFIKRRLKCKNWRKKINVFATCAQIKIVSKKSKRIRFSVKKKRKIKFTKIRKA